MNAKLIEKESWLQTIKRWRNLLSPIVGTSVILVFLYWIWRYHGIILTSLGNIGFAQLIVTVFLMFLALILTVLTLVVLVRDKGYDFHFADGYHALNLSQLASMIPGGVWGFVGFAGFLWSRGISKVDAGIIILLNILIMLSTCAVVGVLGLVSILGWHYAVLSFTPFVFLLFARNRLEGFRKKYYPGSSALPTVKSLLKAATLGVLVWLIISFCFVWMLSSMNGESVISIPIVIGAYAAGYLGGYFAILVPSGLGVSEGLTTLILSPYFKSENVLAAAITFRILHTLVVWANILFSVLVTSGYRKKKGSESASNT